MFLTTHILQKTSFHKNYTRPQQFTFPFSYVPHPWVKQAAEEVQNYLENQNHLDYAFGWDEKSVGKMFGVLVVENHQGELGYLAAFSGKINESNMLPGFVPPVFNVLDPSGFFKKEEAELNQLTKKIIALEQSDELKYLQASLNDAKLQYEKDLKALKLSHKKAKQNRKNRRVDLLKQDEQTRKEQWIILENESKRNHFILKDFKRVYKTKTATLEAKISALQKPLEQLKQKRKNQSTKLQKKVHQKFIFLNALGEQKDLLNLFKPFGLLPPAGAGECAAPRLLHYAYLQGLKPIAMGEFWWGKSPSGVIRKEKQFYPACKSKCKPILTFMLEGVDVEPNPITQNVGDFALDVVYEDEFLLVVNKPAGVLSVPGKTIQQSLQVKLQEKYPQLPIQLVHRLDMATSGLVLVAKSEEIYKALQSQFVNRTIQKTYTAILEGIPKKDSGQIDLPIRVDLDNRPMQMVCEQYGKKAITYYKIVEKLKGNRCKVLFFPYTGRTHQLRVHAAHKDGLNTPILGDVLYGTPKDRLYLHATELVFYHPILNKPLKVFSKVPF